MALDPDAELAIEVIRKAGRPPMHTLSPQEVREGYKAGRRVFAPDPIEIAHLEDLTAPAEGVDIPLRLYRGKGAPDVGAPCLVFLHGGGFCIGDRDTHDGVCRKLANEAACVVISIDYRLAPEHKFPTGLEDCMAAVRWVAREAERLATILENWRSAATAPAATCRLCWRTWRATATCRRSATRCCSIRASK